MDYQSLVDMVVFNFIKGLILVFMPLILGKVVDIVNKKQNIFKIQLEKDQQELIAQYAIKAIFHAEEKDFQTFKNDNVKQLTAPQKLDVATSFFINSLTQSGIKVTFNPEEARNIIESTLPTVRDKLKETYTKLKIDYVKRNNLPENSRLPY